MDWSLILPWNRKAKPAAPAPEQGKGLLADPQALGDKQAYRKYAIDAQTDGGQVLSYEQWTKSKSAPKGGLLR